MSSLVNEKINILVVDDEKSIVNFIKMGLEAEGYTVYEAYNGKEAIEVANKVNSYIVILDIMIPEIDEYEVCSKIKKVLKPQLLCLRQEMK